MAYIDQGLKLPQESLSPCPQGGIQSPKPEARKHQRIHDLTRTAIRRAVRMWGHEDMASAGNDRLWILG